MSCGRLCSLCNSSSAWLFWRSSWHPFVHSRNHSYSLCYPHFAHTSTESARMPRMPLLCSPQTVSWRKEEIVWTSDTWNVHQKVSNLMSTIGAQFRMFIHLKLWIETSSNSIINCAFFLELHKGSCICDKPSIIEHVCVRLAIRSVSATVLIR